MATALYDVNPIKMIRNYRQAKKIKNFLNKTFKENANLYEIKAYNSNTTRQARKQLKQIILKRALGKSYQLLQIKEKEKSTLSYFKPQI